MYSLNRFETFVARVPERVIERELIAITGLAPPPRFPRLSDLGCGVGRVAAPLERRGYAVTGIDVSVEALLGAQRRARGPRCAALDQRHVGTMRWRFDVAIAAALGLFVGSRVRALLGITRSIHLPARGFLYFLLIGVFDGLHLAERLKHHSACLT